MRRMILVLLCGFACRAGISAANIGIVDADENSSDLDALVGAMVGLGHQAEKLPENSLLRPTGLGHYDCLMLTHRSGALTEAEYQALDQYVLEGGTLLLTGAAAYWMKTPDGPKPRIRIAGAGPLLPTAGTELAGFKEAPIKRLLVVERLAATAGLPESFELRTNPPYNADRPDLWRNMGVLPLRAKSARTLIRVETVDAEGNVVESDFLTVNERGKGKCYRLALTRIVPLVFLYNEPQIGLMLQNILRDAELPAFAAHDARMVVNNHRPEKKNP